MDRTLRAALVAALIGLVGVGGIAAFLGVPATASIVSGVVAAVLFGGLLLLAARRADTMAPPGVDTMAPLRVDQAGPTEVDEAASRGTDPTPPGTDPTVDPDGGATAEGSSVLSQDEGDEPAPEDQDH